MHPGRVENDFISTGHTRSLGYHLLESETWQGTFKAIQMDSADQTQRGELQNLETDLMRATVNVMSTTTHTTQQNPREIRYASVFGSPYMSLHKDSSCLWAIQLQGSRDVLWSRNIHLSPFPYLCLFLCSHITLFSSLNR